MVCECICDLQPNAQAAGHKCGAREVTIVTYLQNCVKLIFVGLAMQQLLCGFLSRLQSLRTWQCKLSQHAAINRCTVYMQGIFAIQKRPGIAHFVCVSCNLSV
jgi:hypothetical protein